MSDYINSSIRTRLTRSLTALLGLGAASAATVPAHADDSAATSLYPILDHTLKYRVCSSPSKTLTSGDSWCAEMVSSGAENVFRLIVRNGSEDDACILDTGNRKPGKNPDTEFLRDTFKEKADDSGKRTPLGLDAEMDLITLRYFIEIGAPASNISSLVGNVLEATKSCSFPALTS